MVQKRSRVFCTGDTHCFEDGNQLSSDNFPEGKELTKNDYVIICGDFGFIWDESQDSIKVEERWLKWFEERPWTTLFVDGNHEGYDRLEAYPVFEWNGGKVHKINNSVIHLMRGQVFTINDKTFFTMGGATSIDKAYRQPHVSWWPQELPSYAEQNEALDNLAKYNNKVNYILTHTAPKEILSIYFGDWKTGKIDDPAGMFLQEIAETVDFDDWYFGHMHDYWDEGKYHMLYKEVKRIM